MKCLNLVFCLLAPIFILPFAQATECGTSIAQGAKYNWCIDKGSGADALYYFHGSGGSEHSWSDPGNQEIAKTWQNAGVRSPTVITISFGANWLLTDVNRPGAPALFPLFIKEIMPAMESKIKNFHGRRLLKGESMGGFNGAEVLLKTKNLFARVALVCPGISVVGPFSPQSEVEALIERNKAFIKRDWVMELMDRRKLFLPTPADWAAHDPLRLIKNGFTSVLYISCGREDEYGFFEGVSKFYEQAKRVSSAVTWEPLTGGHCVADPEAIAKFLVK